MTAAPHPPPNQRSGSVPEGLVTLSTLSSQLGFLPPSPAWPEVQRAMDRLKQAKASGAADPEQVQDADTVAGYARTLKDNLPLLTMTLISGFAIGRLGSGKTPSVGEQLLAGLNALNWARGFGVADSLQIVKRAWDWVNSEVSGLGDTMINVDETWGLEQWAIVMEGRIHTVTGQVSWSGQRVETARKTAWELWRHRVTAFLGGPPVEQAFTGEDLLCHAAGVSPATVLRPRLAEVSVQEWSRLVYLWVAEKVPPSEAVSHWAGEAAGIALGFNVRASAINLPPQRSSATASVLVVRRDRDSQTHGWRPNRECPVLAWTREQVNQVRILPDVLLGPAFATAALELPMDRNEADHLTKIFRSLVLEVICFDSVRPAETPDVPFFVIQSVEDLAAVARGLRSDSASSDEAQTARKRTSRKK